MHNPPLPPPILITMEFDFHSIQMSDAKYNHLMRMKRYRVDSPNLIPLQSNHDQYESSSNSSVFDLFDLDLDTFDRFFCSILLNVLVSLVLSFLL